MQFHDYIEMLLGSKVKVKVLRALWRYQGKEFTIRELAKFLGISHTGIKKVLAELEKTNIIEVRTLGKSHAFKLNVESYAARIADEVFEIEEKTLLKLREIIKTKLKSPLVVSAALFGSIVEKRETSGSDIDLFIVTEQREKVEDMVVELQNDVSKRFGNSISAYYVKSIDLQKRKSESPIKQAMQTHLLICGKPFGEGYVRKS